MEPELKNEDIIHLQHAHVTQYSDSKGNSAWKVRKNITNEDLAELPSELTEQQVFKIMEFAREFELISFNEGIKLGKKEIISKYNATTNTYNKNIQLLKEENERLANKLMQLISKEEN